MNYHKNAPTHILTSRDALQAIEAYAYQSPEIERLNYTTNADFSQDVTQTRKDLERVKESADELRPSLIDALTLSDVIESMRSTWGGRVSIKGDALEYCTGQYWCTEYRAACAAVLEKMLTLAKARQ